MVLLASVFVVTKHQFALGADCSRIGLDNHTEKQHYLCAQP